MKQRHKVERENSIGEEVGWSKNVEVAKSNPKLAAMNKKFSMIHGLSSLANIISFGSQFGNLQSKMFPAQSTRYNQIINEDLYMD
ncbi:hypothetical protein Fmac_001417 [Flemingia macrophylla]|uniref:Uncharacterized protein n=1 Tax=Flemingia macrophylla TaxID=520843 RepID=A0ABD1NIA5_9FABA